jgi:diacylglycerol O-acyltransferase / wax synthase
MREVLRSKRAPITSLQKRVGERRRVAVVQATLADIKTIAHACDAKVNDVVLTLTAGGARSLLLARNEHVDGVVLRASVPIAQHADRTTARGNHDGGMLCNVPIGRQLDERARLRAIAEDTTIRKQQPRPSFDMPAFPGSLAVLRRLMRGMGTQRLANLYAANIAGPPMPMYLAGARLVGLAPVVPINGNVTIGVGALSYAGSFSIAIVADADACPDLDIFVDGVRDTLADLQAAASAGHDHGLQRLAEDQMPAPNARLSLQ